MEKSIVVFFAGNNPDHSYTKEAALSIASLTGSDTFQIECLNPYSQDMATCVKEALHDKEVKARPSVLGPFPDLKDYAYIFLGFPNWCGTAPMPVFTFMDHYQKDGSLKGMKFIPFVINDGAGLQNCVKDLEKTYPEADFEFAQPIESGALESAGLRSIDWIQKFM